MKFGMFRFRLPEAPSPTTLAVAMTLPTRLLFVAASVLVAALLAATLHAGVRVLEAETIPGAGDSVRQDPSARAGAYATNPRPWNPVIKAPVTADAAALTVWARLRGGPFQLKGTPAGKQADLKWHYDRPDEWTWVNFGTYERARLGEQILIIRGANLIDDGGIDTVVFSASAGFDPASLAAGGTSAPTPPPAAIPPITVPSGGWFPPGWVSRRTAFRDSLAADQGAVVFVGDSITQGFKAHETFPGLKTANRGISGDLVANLRHRLEGDVLAVNPSAVVVLMGTNDAKDGKDPAKIVADIRAAAEKIHAAHPAAPIIVCRLLPRAPRADQPREAAILPGAILAVNKLIDRLPAELPWLRIVDPFSPMAQPDGSPRREFFGDGVHPNGAGNEQLRLAIEPALRAAGVLK
jgi:beta-glucosidase